MSLLMRKFLLFCLMLWLPLQGYASTVMPFCQHAQQGQHSSHQLAQQDNPGAPTNHDQHSGKTDTTCDNCSLCQMSSAMALPSFSSQANFQSDHRFAMPDLAAFIPFFPEQPQHPPLA